MDKYFAIDGKFDKLKDQLSNKLLNLEDTVGKNSNSFNQDMSNVRQQVSGLKYRLDNYKPGCCQNFKAMNQTLVSEHEKLEQILNHVRREAMTRQTKINEMSNMMSGLKSDLKNVNTLVMRTDNEADTDRAELLKDLNKLKQDLIRVNYTMQAYVNNKVSKLI